MVIAGMKPSLKRWLLIFCFIAGILRWHGLFANRFHADEALYASWARLIAVGRDPFLWHQVVDKPPLLFYLQAIFYPLLGTPSAWVARLPNLIASLLLIPMVGQLVWRLYADERATLLTVGGLTLSPFLIQFSPTAFTDPLLLFFLFSALTAQTFAGKERLAGILFGCAIATKQPAWLFAPLVAGMGWQMGWRKREWVNAGIGFVTVALPLALWDGWRGDNNSWARLSQNYGAIRLTDWSDLGERWVEWGKLLALTHGSFLFGWLVILLLPIGIYYLFRHDKERKLNKQLLLQTTKLYLTVPRSWRCNSLPYSVASHRVTAFDRLFSAFLLFYLLFHWFSTIPVWDRYILPAIPLAAMLFGRLLSRLCRKSRRPTFVFGGMILLMLGLISPASIRARNGSYPIGGMPQADLGAEQIAQYLERYPYGTVLYDHSFGWHWRYYLFDKTVYHAWFPDTDELLTDLEGFGEQGTRLLILPPDERATPIQIALESAGYQLQLLFTSYHANGDAGIQLYQILPNAGN